MASRSRSGLVTRILVLSYLSPTSGNVSRRWGEPAMTTGEVFVCAEVSAAPSTPRDSGSVTDGISCFSACHLRRSFHAYPFIAGLLIFPLVTYPQVELAMLHVNILNLTYPLYIAPLEKGVRYLAREMTDKSSPIALGTVDARGDMMRPTGRKFSVFLRGKTKRPECSLFRDVESFVRIQLSSRAIRTDHGKLTSTV